MADPTARQVESESSGAATNARKRAVAFTGAKSNPVAIDVTILAAGPLQQGQAAAGSTAADMPGRGGQEEATEGAGGGDEPATEQLSAAAGTEQRTSPDAAAAAGLLMDLSGMTWARVTADKVQESCSYQQSAHCSLQVAPWQKTCQLAQLRLAKHVNQLINYGDVCWPSCQPCRCHEWSTSRHHAS